MARTRHGLATLALLFTGLASAQTTDSATGVVAGGSSGEPVVGAAVVGSGPAGFGAVEGDAVVVTGSRIGRMDLTAAAPVTVLSREQLQASGMISLGEFLQTLPEQGNAVNAQVNNGNDGSVRVNLRSLGSSRTLVLVNGRRLVAGGTGADASVDLGAIPAASVERIEILTDGASAVYGSDAIAGVVNVITRKRLDGTEVSAYAGQTSRGDGTSYDLSATTGVGSERGHLLFSLGYQKQAPISAGDRDWSKQSTVYDFGTGQPRVLEGNSLTTPDGRFSLPSGACTGATDPDLVALCALPGTTNEFIPNGDGTFRRGVESYNTYPTTYLYTPSQRIQLFSTGDANLGAVARAFYEASYVNRHSTQNLAPRPVVMNSATGNPISKDSMYNPFGVDLVSWRRRTAEFGNQTWTQDVDTFRVVLGFDGALGDWAGPLHGWKWEASCDYGKTAGTEESDGQLWANRIGTAVGPSFQHPVGGPVCGDVGADGIAGTADDRIVAGCVPMNVLGGQGTLTPEMKAYVGYRGVSKSSRTMEVYSASIGGALFTLGADRAAGLSVGVDHRKEKGLDLPDPVTAAGLSTGGTASPTEGGFDATEAYAELLLPLLGGRPGVHDLELSLAARAFRYSTFGSDGAYTVGLRYAPVRDLVLRGTYGTSYRAPSIGELYAAGTSTSYDSLPNGDPCATTNAGQCGVDGVPPGGTGDTATRVPTMKMANPDLRPETARVLTLGAVIEPRWVPGLAVTLGYYAIDLTRAVIFQGASVILDGCYTQGLQADCALVHRDASGLIVRVDDKAWNAGATRTAGLDVSARYGVSAGRAGRFDVLLDGTFLQYFDETLADLSVIEHRGNYDGQLLMPTFKGFGQVTWTMGGLGAGLTGRYLGSLKECENLACSFDDTNSHTVSAYLTADLYLSYLLRSVAGTTSLQVGVQNVADTQPPPIYTAASYSADPGYPYPGRFFYARLAHGF
jgi:iron complex outermembrane receptor protein